MLSLDVKISVILTGRVAIIAFTFSESLTIKLNSEQNVPPTPFMIQ